MDQKMEEPRFVQPEDGTSHRWQLRSRALQQLKLGEDAQLQSGKALLGTQNAKNMRIWNQFRIFTEISQHDLIFFGCQCEAIGLRKSHNDISRSLARSFDQLCCIRVVTGLSVKRTLGNFGTWRLWQSVVLSGCRWNCSKTIWNIGLKTS